MLSTTLGFGRDRFRGPMKDAYSYSLGYKMTIQVVVLQFIKSPDRETLILRDVVEERRHLKSGMNQASRRHQARQATQQGADPR